MYTDIVDIRRANALGALPGQLVGGSFKAIGLVFAIIFAPVRWLLLPLMMGGRAGGRTPNEVAVQVRSFRVTTDDGTVRECQLRGELRGGFVEIGDHVRVEGRTARSSGNLVLVSRVQELHTGQIITVQLPAAVRMATARSIVGGVVLLLVLIVVFSACSQLVRW